MSEESTPDLVELTRRAYESFSRRDLNAVMSDYDHDSVLRPRGIGVGDVAGELMTTRWSSPTTDEMGWVSAYF
jgi:hypothetical protein